MIRRSVALGALAVAVATATTSAGCSGHPRQSHGVAGTIGPHGGSVTGLGGRVRVTVPDGADRGAAKIGFNSVQPASLPRSAFRLDPYAHPMLIVHVNVQGGSIVRYRARVTMKLPAGLPRRYARDVYLAIYESRLQAFVHLPTTVSWRRGIATAVAPHFSRVGEFIDTLKHAGAEAVKAADIVSLGPLAVIPAVRHYVENLQKEAFDALFAIPPKLRCDPPSKAKAFEVDGSNGRLFQDCAEDIPSRPGYVRIKMRNAFAFPMLLWPGNGVGVGFADVPENSSLLDFVRHVFWMQFNKEDAVGASVAELTISPQVRLPMQFNGNLDWGAVAADVAMTVALDILVPESKAVDPALESIMQTVRAAAESKTGPDAYAAAESALASLQRNGATAENLDKVLGVAGCAVNAISKITALTRQGKASLADVLKAVGEAVADCVRTQLADLGDDVTKVVSGIAEDLKVIPEGTQAKLAGILKTVGINLTHVTVGLNSPPPPPPTDGVYYGRIVSYIPQGRVLQYARSEFAFGPGGEAEKLCRENGVPIPPSGELCHDYYLKDDNIVDTVPVSKSVQITDWHKYGKQVPLNAPTRYSLKQFAKTVTTFPGKLDFFKLTIQGGQVVRINGIYLP